MFEPTIDQLFEERDELEEYERSCVGLTELIEGNLDLEMSDYAHKLSLQTLNRVADVIQHRIHTINDELEREKNQALDMFRRRQIE